MAAPFEYRTPQYMETPAVYGEFGTFHYRYAYSRSIDSLKNNENGQDFLSILTDGSRFVFALCDGVSQSFYGDLAARLLGGQLIEFFKHVRISENPEKIKVDLSSSLNRLTDTATQQVQDYTIPAGLAPMLVSVLEKKKQMGSESTFVAGVLDAKSGIACFAWMGDSRLRLWNDETEVTHLLGESFHTNERWSTRKGAVGDVHVITLPSSAFNHLITYSDGFSYLDKAFTQEVAVHPWSHHIINQFMSDASRRPSSDDISFLEVWLGKKPNIPDGSESLLQPQVETPTINSSEEYLEMKWKPVPGASEYEIEISSDVGVLFSQKVIDAYWRTGGITQQARKVSIRAWKGSMPGLWSKPLPLPNRQLELSQTFTPIYESNNFNYPEKTINTTSTFPVRDENKGLNHPISKTKKREYVFAWIFDWRKISIGLFGIVVFIAFIRVGMKYISKDFLDEDLPIPNASDITVAPTIYQFLPTIFPTETTTIITATQDVSVMPLETEVNSFKAIVREHQLLQYPALYSQTLPPPAIGEEVIILYKYKVEGPEEFFFYVQRGESKGWMKDSWLDLTNVDETKIPDAPEELISTPVPTPSG